MRAVIQITQRAKLTCEDEVRALCNRGMCILVGFCDKDGTEEADFIVDKILKMRIFADEKGKLNLSPLAVGADLLLVSNFTLYANTNSRRPDFLRAMKFQPAKELYDYMLARLEERAQQLKAEGEPGARIFSGVFGGDMQVEIVNDGPITILLDTDEK